MRLANSEIADPRGFNAVSVFVKLIITVVLVSLPRDALHPSAVNAMAILSVCMFVRQTYSSVSKRPDGSDWFWERRLYSRHTLRRNIVFESPKG